MKTRIIIASALMLLAFGNARAQENEKIQVDAVVVKTTGLVTIQQGEKFMVFWDVDEKGRYELSNGEVTLFGTSDFVVTVQDLKALTMVTTGNVVSDVVLKGKNLRIDVLGTGDVNLKLDYNNVYVRSKGTGDVHLSGHCDALFAEMSSPGDVDVKGLDYVLGLVNVSSHGIISMGKSPQYIAYHAEAPASSMNVLDDGLLNEKCAQGSKIRFVEKDGQWKLNVCEPKDETVAVVLQKAAPFFSAASKTSPNTKGKSGKSSESGWDKETFKELMAELDENMQHLSDSVDWKSFESDMEKWAGDMEEWGRKMEDWGNKVESQHRYKWYDRHGYYYDSYGSEKKRGLLFNASWNGFEAGLNMLLEPAGDLYANGGNDGTQGMDLRPLRSWYFGFNIADVGIAFDRRHRVGMFTGIGLGWNNYSWKNNVTVAYDPDKVVYSLVPIDTNYVVRNSKMGVLYLQAPLMIEVRPTRRMYVDLGVTGGIRITAWSKVKYGSGMKTKDYFGKNALNFFKLDASLRVGGDDMGFFINYALVPLFTSWSMSTPVHPLSFGFSINF